MGNVLKQHYCIYYGGYKLSHQMRCWLLDRGGGWQRSEGGKKEASRTGNAMRKKGQMEEKTAPRQSRLTDKLSGAR